MLIIAVTGVALHYLGAMIAINNVFDFILLLVVNVIGINLIFLLLMYRSAEFAYCKSIIVDKFIRKKKPEES